ncbi:MAG: hypothetical protein ACRCYQ_12575 [Nocardioides sp.]
MTKSDLYLLAALLLLGWASLQSIRISNHVFLAILTLAGWGLSQSGQAAWSSGLLGGVYIAAGFYKLNRNFLFSTNSVPLILLNDYARHLGFTLPGRPVTRALPSMIVLVELTLGATVFFLGVNYWVFGVAFVMHLIFSIIGHLHFSLISMAVLLSAAKGNVEIQSSAIAVTWLFALSIGALIAVFSVPWVFVHKKLGRSINFIGGVAYAYPFVPIMMARPEFPDELDWRSRAAAAMLIGFIMTLVFAGIKTEWSFAMFSNTRPYAWSHLLIRRPRQWRVRYFALGIQPADLSRIRSLIPKDVYSHLLQRSSVFHEGVAAAILEVSMRYSVTLSIIRVCPDEDGYLLPCRHDQRSPRRVPIMQPPFLDAAPNSPYFG